MDEKNTAPQGRGAENHRGSKSVNVIQVIEVKTTIGKGTERDPNRIIAEYWSLDGVLLAVYDPESNPCGHLPFQR